MTRPAWTAAGDAGMLPPATTLRAAMNLCALPGRALRLAHPLRTPAVLATLTLATGALVACDDTEPTAAGTLDAASATDAATDAGTGGDAASSGDGAPPPGDLGVPDPLPSAAPAGAPLAVALAETPGRTFRLSVRGGGGTVTPDEVTVGGDGQLAFTWTLGPAPVDQRLRVEPAEGGPGGGRDFTVRATLDAPYAAAAFGEVDGWLRAADRTGSTEDLTFRGEDLLLGIPGGLLRVGPDGSAEEVALTGEVVQGVWGFAADADEVLWAVDFGVGRVVRIAPDGEVEEAITTNGATPLVGPNYVAVGHDGRIYVSDPCAGEIVRFDPVTGAHATHTFDLLTDGGPNGMAVGPDGALYVATENTGLLCSHAQVPPTDEIAGVFRLDLADFTTRTPVVERMGLFGDGLAFDAEGNLYVVVDTAEGLRLKESDVRVIPAGTQEIIPFVRAAPRELIANVAFGRGAYGSTTLYLAMLHIPPFTTLASRGVTRIETGIAGLPLLP